MSEEIWLKFLEQLPAIIAAVGSVITAVGVIVVGFFAYKSKKQGEAAVIATETVAEKAEQVRQTLVDTSTLTEGHFEQLHITGEHTLALVNGATTANLEIIAFDKRRIASITKDDLDAEAATLAESVLTEHKRKLAVITPKLVALDRRESSIS